MQGLGISEGTLAPHHIPFTLTLAQEPKKGGSKKWHLNRVELSMGEGNERWFPLGDWMSATDNNSVDIPGKVGEGATPLATRLSCRPTFDR